MEQRRPLTPVANGQVTEPAEAALELAADLAAIRGGAAVGRVPLELLVVGGPDRERLLHGLVTSDIRGLAPGGTAHGFFTSGQGRILADFRLLSRQDDFWLLLPAGTAATIATHLDKYKLASNVELGARLDSPVFELRGPQAGGIVEEALGDGKVVALRDPVAGSDRFLLLPVAPGNLAFVDSWLREAEKLRLRRVAEESLEIARIEDGELRFGVDFGGENFPQETGREEAVSYTKGCFLGQEVVARIHYRGGVQKVPCGIHFETADLPPVGTELLFEGRAVGRATSVARSPAAGAIGLGILHRRGSAIGTRLESAVGGDALVVPLPFIARGEG